MGNWDNKALQKLAQRAAKGDEKAQQAIVAATTPDSKPVPAVK